MRSVLSFCCLRSSLYMSAGENKSRLRHTVHIWHPSLCAAHALTSYSVTLDQETLTCTFISLLVGCILQTYHSSYRKSLHLSTEKESNRKTHQMFCFFLLLFLIACQYLGGAGRRLHDEKWTLSILRAWRETITQTGKEQKEWDKAWSVC